MSELDEDTLTLFSSLTNDLPTMRANIAESEAVKNKIRADFKAAQGKR